MSNHHKFAAIVYGLTVLFAVGLGSLYALVEHLSEGLGLYWAVQTISTVGFGDLSPRTNLGHYVAVATIIIGVAFWNFSFGLVTSWLISFGMRDVKKEVTASAKKTREHVTETVGA